MQSISLIDGIFEKIKKKDHLGLIKDLTFVISANPNSPGCTDLYKFIACSQIELGNNVTAIETLDKVLVINPHDYEVYKLRESLKILLANQEADSLK